MAQLMMVRVKGEEVQFSSSLTNDEALRRLQQLKSSFAADLLAKSNRLSPAQWSWVHKLAMDAERPPEPMESVDGLMPLVQLMATAATNLKFPKITFDVGGSVVQLSVAGSMSRYPGTINVTDGGKFGENKWYGRIGLDGIMTGSRMLTDEIRAAITHLSTNPVEFAAAFGKRTGNCCFCRKQLTDARSVNVGYGAKCASNFGLPWGQ